jgi:uncharacterized protein YbjT (DUF2867 family)
MLTIAVLGATGQAGIEVANLLINDPSYSEYHLRIWARSLHKIHNTFPNLPENVEVFTGSINDPEYLHRLLERGGCIHLGNISRSEWIRVQHLISVGTIDRTSSVLSRRLKEVFGSAPS